MCKVSVIVPFFRGEKYLQGILSQIEQCAEFVPEESIELVLSSDNPEATTVVPRESSSIKIKVLNTDKNRGIHGARVRGLSCAGGEFVLFLDQDDKIVPEYIDSQLQGIGDADAVVCRCIHERKIYYNEAFPFEKMMTKKYMLTEGCPIISPGQVLLRKSSIPDIWKNNIMETNCADDFLLWLSMIAENKIFALNQKILFEHVVHYGNTSWDSYRMTRSEREMADILIRNKAFAAEDTVLLKKMLTNIEKKRMKQLDKFRRMFYLLNDWTMLDRKESGIARYLKEKNVYNIAIYGVGYLGKHLIWELEDSGICIKYLIDRNADWLHEKCKVVSLNDELENVDAVIVTLVQDEGDIVEELERKTGAKIYTISELVWKAAEEITV